MQPDQFDKRLSVFRRTYSETLDCRSEYRPIELSVMWAFACHAASAAWYAEDDLYELCHTIRNVNDADLSPDDWKAVRDWAGTCFCLTIRPHRPSGNVLPQTLALFFYDDEDPNSWAAEFEILGHLIFASPKEADIPVSVEHVFSPSMFDGEGIDADAA